jgi:DNA-directed RNA polymerase subunit RPC12/RpoP
MKCSRCDKDFEKEDLQKCMDDTYKCLECVDDLIDEYYEETQSD